MSRSVNLIAAPLVELRARRYSGGVSRLLTSEEAVWYLAGLELNSRVRDEGVEAVKEAGRLMRWGHRASIATRGPDEITLLVSGSVDVNDGHHRSPIRLRAGDVFGWTGDDPGDDVGLQAYDDTIVCNLGREDFESLVGENLGNFVTRAGLRPRVDLEIPVGELLYRPASSRMALVLLHLAESREGESRIEVKLKPRHLASLAGIAPARSRQLYDSFRKQNLIETTANGILIPNLELVRDLASKSKKE